MNFKTIILTSLLCFVAHAFVQAADAPTPKYKRAMIFQGGGFQTSYFLGMFDAAESLGLKPDVVIATCGGALAAAVVNSSDNPIERLNFVESEEFYRALRAINFTGNQWLPSALEITLSIRRAARENKIPNFFDNFLMNVPQDLGIAKLAKPLSESPTHLVFVSGQVQFAPGQVGAQSYPGERLYKEVFFTDARLAPLLSEFKSPVAETFPDSRVMLETETILGVDGLTAARASISDPFYMQPKRIGGSDYITGSIDLYPLEVAKTVADEVIAGRGAAFDTLVEQPTIKAVFGYDHNARQRQVDDQYADYWIDMTDEAKLFNSIGFNPRLSLVKLKVARRIPNAYQDYVRRVRKLWQIGYDRAIEALSQKTKNDKCHMRGLKDEERRRTGKTTLRY